MIVRLELQMPNVEVPDDLRTGDKVRVDAVGVVTAIKDDLIDITPMGGPPQVTTGERTMTVLGELAAVDLA